MYTPFEATPEGNVAVQIDAPTAALLMAVYQQGTTTSVKPGGAPITQLSEDPLARLEEEMVNEELTVKKQTLFNDRNDRAETVLFALIENMRLTDDEAYDEVYETVWERSDALAVLGAFNAIAVSGNTDVGSEQSAGGLLGDSSSERYPERTRLAMLAAAWVSVLTESLFQ